MQQHYERMCKVVRTRAILSLGLACFRWDTRTTETTTCSRDEQGLKVTSDSCEVVRVCPSVEVEVFNIWLLCQEAYTIDPVSAKFLVAHGFDFNKQFSLGLPYTPPEARTKTHSEPRHSLDVVLACLMSCGKPLVLHNGWLDLLHLYHACYGPLPHDTTTLFADLTDMFPAGLYDTKAIAQFKFYEEATFLEYLFRRSQRWSGAWKSHDTSQVMLRYPLVAGDGRTMVEEVDVSPPPSLPPSQLALVQVCDNFASQGYCHAPHCPKSHDVMIAIEQKEYLAKVQRTQRKRKRSKGREKDAPTESCDIELSSCDSHKIHKAEEQENKTERGMEMASFFQREIATAKAKLSLATLTSQTTTNGRVFGSHRSGVDAFMTGFIFTCFALQSQTDTMEGSGGVSVNGLGDLRNCLASRPSTKQKMPLRIIKSQFAKHSNIHIAAKARLDAIGSEDITAKDLPANTHTHQSRTEF